MDEKIIYGIAVSIVMIFIVLSICFLTLFQIKKSVVDIECCNGSQCSDTYYTQEDNLCHLTLCESFLFADKSQCTYKGANKSIDLVNANKGIMK